MHCVLAGARTLLVSGSTMLVCTYARVASAACAYIASGSTGLIDHGTHVRTRTLLASVALTAREPSPNPRELSVSEC